MTRHDADSGTWARLGAAVDRLGWPADGVQLADAATVGARHYPPIDPDRPALVYGVRAPVLPLTAVLGLQYPAAHPIVVLVGDGGGGLARIDLTLGMFFDGAIAAAEAIVAVPPLPSASSLAGLADVIAHLRAPDGCPWDREQTHRSLRPFLLEEAHEALAALDADDPRALREELGDVLLQIVLHAQVAVEAGEFGLADIVRGITAKLIRRHPHVFGEVRADTADDVRRNWEALKRQERAEKGAPADPFADIPPTLPALSRAQAVQEKIARLGAGDSRAAAPGDMAFMADAGGDADGPPTAAPASIEERGERLGTVLWSLVSMARAWDVDAESALREATGRVEASLRPQPMTMEDRP